MQRQTHNQKFDMIIRGIVMTRGERGATIEEMRSDYFEMVGEQWLLKRRKTESIVSYLNEIGGLMLEKMDTGLCIWYIDDIGSNLSDRVMDSNNNVNVAAGPSDGSGDVQDNSNGCVDPLRRQMTTTSFDSGTSIQTLSTTATTSSTSSSSSEAITVSSSTSSDIYGQNDRESDKLKRRLSHNDSVPLCSHGGKRKKSNEADPAPLIEKNLSFHNWNSGATDVMKKLATTSTEKENSILVQNGGAVGVIDTIECIEVIDDVSDTDYVAPDKDTDMKQLQKVFPERCQIDAKSNSVETISAASTDSMGDQPGLFPPGSAFIGDDFMRTMISFELFGGDFTHETDKAFSYCNAGQTIRQAYHMILDKRNEFKALYPRIVVNVGAIDILLLKNLIDIQFEYARLVKGIVSIGCVPILTTIPDLRVSPNNPNQKIIRQMVLLFNRFLEDLYVDGYHLIDLYSCLDGSDYTLQPKIIDVFNKDLETLMWSKSGRKKIIDALNQVY